MTLYIRSQIAFHQFRYESATARLTLWNDGWGHVSGVYSRKLGEGHATAVLNGICQFADDRKIPLSLEVSAYGPKRDDKLDNMQLEAFYQRFGFKRVDDGALPIWMERQPK